MNENYIENVRRILYSDLNKKTDDLNKKMPKKPSKITFGTDNYKSENVFCSIPDQHIKTKTKKTRKVKNSLGNDLFKHSSEYKEIQKKIISRRTRPNLLSPSTSENSDLNPNQKKCFVSKRLWRKRTSDFIEQSELGLNELFSTKEPSFNESFIESHSGIDYEFPSNGAIRSFQIISSSILDDHSNSVNGHQSNDVHSNEMEEGTLNFSNNISNFQIINSSTLDDSNSADHVNEYQSNDVNNFKEEDEETFNFSDNISSIDNATFNNGNHYAPHLVTFQQEKQKDQSSDSVCLVEMENEIIFISSESEQQTSQQRNSCQCLDLGFQKLVILKEKYSVPIFGLCSLKVLHGRIDILGYTLTKHFKEVKIYSPRGSSLLVIKNVTNNNQENDFKEIQPILDRNESLKNVKIQNTSAVFLCSKIEDNKIKFLEKYISQQIFPKLDVYRAPQIIFNPKDKFNIISTSRQWETVIKLVSPSTRLLVAGGKGVGKSTFLRYSINKLLFRFKKIRIIDLDPGQSEFSLPGCISVVTLSDPIFGPNYTHLQNTERSYLSDINIGQDPKRYLQLIKFLMESLHITENLPTLINYMGFSKGIGLNIISSAITYLKPTDIIQIDSQNNKKNFKTDLSVRTVKEHFNLFGGNLGNLNFNLMKMSAMNDDNSGWSLEPRQTREMCVLAYFGEMMKNGAESLTSHNLPMLEIGLESINITDSEGKKIPPAAVNASMVALCSLKNPQTFKVFGYGIVRGVDIQARKLVLITPVSINVLENVYYLVLSSVSLPPSVFMTAEDINGSIPYVMEGELGALGQITKRSYIPPNKK